MRVLRATLPGTGNAYLPPGSGRSCGEPELRRAVATRAKEWADVRRLEVRANGGGKPRPTGKGPTGRSPWGPLRRVLCSAVMPLDVLGGTRDTLTEPASSPLSERSG